MSFQLGQGQALCLLAAAVPEKCPTSKIDYGTHASRLRRSLGRQENVVGLGEQTISMGYLFRMLPCLIPSHSTRTWLCLSAG